MEFTSEALLSGLPMSSTTSLAVSHCRATQELPGLQLMQLWRPAVGGKPMGHFLCVSPCLAASSHIDFLLITTSARVQRSREFGSVAVNQSKPRNVPKCYKMDFSRFQSLWK